MSMGHQKIYTYVFMGEEFDSEIKILIRRQKIVFWADLLFMLDSRSYFWPLKSDFRAPPYQYKIDFGPQIFFTI